VKHISFCCQIVLFFLQSNRGTSFFSLFIYLKFQFRSANHLTVFHHKLPLFEYYQLYFIARWIFCLKKYFHSYRLIFENYYFLRKWCFDLFNMMGFWNYFYKYFAYVFLLYIIIFRGVIYRRSFTYLLWKYFSFTFSLNIFGSLCLNISVYLPFIQI